jgi:peptide deformylase
VGKILTKREVLLLGNRDLRKLSKKVVSFDEEIKKIIHDLEDTLVSLQKKYKIGRALAAPQIGYFKRIVFMQRGNKRFVMINPEIVWKSDDTFDVWDSCFSFNVAFFVNIERYKKIKIEYLDENGKAQTGYFSDDLSELFQHEIDHLDGILCTDHLKDNSKIVMRSEWEKMNQ